MRKMGEEPSDGIREDGCNSHLSRIMRKSSADSGCFHLIRYWCCKFFFIIKIFLIFVDVG